MGILSGLKNMGVDLKKEDMFENNKPKTAPKPKPQPVVKASNVENEEDFVLPGLWERTLTFVLSMPLWTL